MVKDANTMVFSRLLPDPDTQLMAGRMMDRIAKNMDMPTSFTEMLSLASQVYDALEKYEQLQPLFQGVE